jgi:hypothetical protein
MLRAYRDDPISIALPNGKPNPLFLYRGAVHGRPPTPHEEVKRDLVAELHQRGVENLEAHLLEEALFDFETVIELLPEFPYAHWNRAQVLLMLNRYREGFEEFDWRFKLFADDLWHSGIPLWNGEDIAGKRLLLWHEHGYGDTLMLLRFVPEIARRGVIVTLSLVPPLRRIARQLGVEVLDADIPRGREFDFRLPLFNLPAALSTLADTVPPAPYLTAPRTIKISAPAIGIAWSGNAKQSRDHLRSLELERFLALLELNGHQPYALQLAGEDAAARGVMVRDYADFAELAEWVMAMDHVVTVCTAVAHLAGALGHPSLHVVVPKVAYWPWYNAQRWYGGAHVYRQRCAGDWGQVFARVNRALWSEPSCR